MKTFAKIKQDKWLGGVCAGFAYALGIPTWLTRLAMVLLSLSVGFGVVAYILLWIFMPEWHVDPTDYRERTTPNVGPPAQ